MKEISTIEIGQEDNNNKKPSMALTIIPAEQKSLFKQFVSKIIGLFRIDDMEDNLAIQKLGIAVKKYRYSLAIIGLVFMLIFRNDNTNATGLKTENREILSNKSSFDNEAIIVAESTPKKEKAANSTTKKDQVKLTKTDRNGEEMKSFHTPSIPEVSKNKKQVSDLSKSTEKAIQLYISKYLKFATEESAKTNIPTSVILGLALLNSNFGLSKIATESNNHFDIKCSENTIPMGKGMKGQYVNNEFCFTEYKSAWASYRAHSNLISKAVKKHVGNKKTNSSVVIEALEKSAYFDERAFSKTQLQNCIKENNLKRFDK